MLPATMSWLAALTVCPEPCGPTCTMVLPTASKTGRRGVEVVGVAADHDRQRGRRPRRPRRRRPGRRASGSPAPRLRGELGGDVGPDRGEVDDQRARAWRRRRLRPRRPAPPARPGSPAPSVPRCRPSRTASATDSAPRPPALDQRGRPRPGCGCSPTTSIPGVDEVTGHRAAHDAQADEGDGGHARSPLDSGGGLRRASASRASRDRPVAGGHLGVVERAAVQAAGEERRRAPARSPARPARRRRCGTGSRAAGRPPPAVPPGRTRTPPGSG